MLFGIYVTDTLPGTAVLFVYISGALILIVLPPCFGFMFLAILPVT